MLPKIFVLSFSRRSARKLWRTSPFLKFTPILLVLTAIINGCSSPESEISEPLDSEDSQSERVSQVPLRIWITAQVDQPEILTRQWLSDSEQPIELTTLSEAELLQHSELPADVLLAPTRLLGELLHREWVVKLPDRLLRDPSSSVADADKSDEELQLRRAPAGLITATSYAGIQYGLPVGHSMIHMVGSSAVEDSELSWEMLSNRMEEYEISPLEIDDSEVDRNALVDRFLAIAMGVSTVNAKYGVLFEIRSMQSRLDADEFQFAAGLLQKLANQPGSSSGIGVIGSHAAAWDWIHRSDPPAYALISVSSLDAQARTQEGAHWIPLADSRFWNDGSGLMATMPTQCRQTSGAIRFMQWIRNDRVLADLRYSIPGVSPVRNAGITLADRIAQKELQQFQDQNLVCEPRMPHTSDYRLALAKHLLSMLRGEQTALEALSAAAADWDQITESQIKIQKVEYERSLGLTL